MPRTVILTANPRYDRHPYARVRGPVGERVLSDNASWAEQVDYLVDRVGTQWGRGEPTPRTRGQRVMHHVLPPPVGGFTADADATHTAIVGEVTAGYVRAARWAGSRGVIGVLMGHGDAAIDTNLVFADLGPAGHLRVTVDDLGQVSAAEASGGRASLSPELRAVAKIGRALRAQRISRVDLLTCNVGVGPHGQRLLDAFHRAWHTPVRGLVGTLVSGLVRDADGVHYSAWVESSGQRAPSGRPEDTFVDRLPPDRYWARSRRR